MIGFGNRGTVVGVETQYISDVVSNLSEYTAKIANVKKTAIVSTVRTITAGFSANYLNNKRKGLTRSLASLFLGKQLDEKITE